MQLARITHKELATAINLLTPRNKESSAAAMIRLLSRKINLTTETVCHECGIVNASDTALRANFRLASIGLFIGSMRHPLKKQWIWNIYRLPAANDDTYFLNEEV